MKTVIVQNEWNQCINFARMLRFYMPSNRICRLFSIAAVRMLLNKRNNQLTEALDELEYLICNPALWPDRIDKIGSPDALTIGIYGSWETPKLTKLIEVIAKQTERQHYRHAIDYNDYEDIGKLRRWLRKAHVVLDVLRFKDRTSGVRDIAFNVIGFPAMCSRRHRRNQVLDIWRDMVNPYEHYQFSDSILSYNDNLVLKVARSIYENKTFESMPILADALEEAGCTNIETFNHCRSRKKHYKGCWLLDRILGTDEIGVKNDKSRMAKCPKEFPYSAQTGS